MSFRRSPDFGHMLVGRNKRRIFVANLHVGHLGFYQDSVAAHGVRWLCQYSRRLDAPEKRTNKETDIPRDCDSFDRPYGRHDQSFPVGPRVYGELLIIT